ncbi:MAG: MFS transporter [Bacillota bacterium]|nr:MFS transporter [Bacillota bacterium]
MGVNTIYGVVVLYNMVLSMYLLLFPLYLDHLVFSPMLIGALVSVPSVFQLLLNLPMGASIDRIGEHNAAKISSGTFLIAIAFFFARPLLPFFIVIQLFLGISTTLFWPSVQAYVASMHYRTLGYRMGMFNLLTGFAGIVGPLAGGFSKDLVGPQRSFYVLLAAAVVLTLFTLFLPKLDKGETTEQSLGFLETMLVVIKEKSLYFAGIATFCGAASWALVGSFYPIYMQNQLGFSSTLVGLLVGFRALSSAPGGFLGGLYLEKIKFKWMFLGNIFMGAAGFFLIPLTNHYGLQLLFISLIGFSSGALQTVALVFVGEVTPKSQMGTAMAFIGLFWSLAMALIPPILGALDLFHASVKFGGLGMMFLLMGGAGLYFLMKYQPVKRVG